MTRRIARVTLNVDVHVGTDAGINTPDAYEPPYEYLVVRSVEEVGTHVFGDSRPLALIGLDDFPDHDPDDLIRAALMSALDSAREEPTR